MKVSNIVLNKSYRHKAHPNYCWAKVIEILKPKSKENPCNRVLLKCEYSVDKDGMVGIIKYFRPIDLIEQN